MPRCDRTAEMFVEPASSSSSSSLEDFILEDPEERQTRLDETALEALVAEVPYDLEPETDFDERPRSSSDPDVAGRARGLRAAAEDGADR